MNYIFLSPHFPPNWYNFCVRLKESGFNVLGLGEEPYDNLRQELKSSFTEYYKVQDMNDYDQITRAIGYLTWKYGKIQYVESHNEHWLELEARIREDFNIEGYRLGSIEAIKRKSKMKRVFQVADVPVAPGQLATSFETAKDFVEKVNYPVIAKPDIGVGAYATYKIHNDQELMDFFATKPDVMYFLEAFIDGTIISYDGLTDQNGDVVFSTSLQYSQGIMEVVNGDLDIYYWLNNEIPEDVKKYGNISVKAFEPKARFFHMEFFRLKNDKLVALEANLRPPGGFTVDMWNFACDSDLYREYANILKENKVYSNLNFVNQVFYIGRKHKYNYIHTHNEILDKYRNKIAFQTQMPDVFSRAMGNNGYIFRAASKTEMKEIVEFVGLKK
jgi:hypothetical protein